MNTGLIAAKISEQKYSEAETIALATIAENDRLFGPNYFQTAWAYFQFNRALLPQSKHAEALEAAKQAVAIMRKRISPDQVWYGMQLRRVFDTLVAASSARALTNLFSSADQLGQLEALFQERLGTKPLSPKDSDDPANVAMQAVPQFPSFYLELASELTAAGNTNEAAECRRKATALIEQLETQSRTNAGALDTSAAAYAQAGQFDKAVATQKEAIALLPNGQTNKFFALCPPLYQSSIPYRGHGLLAENALSLLQAGKFAESRDHTRLPALS